MQTDWSRDYMTEDDARVAWPRQYKALPVGYSVWWVGCVEHFMALGPLDAESPVFSDRYAARRWCFSHHRRSLVGPL